MIFPQTWLLFVNFFLMAERSVARKTYVVLAPKTIHLSSDNEVLITVSGLTEAERNLRVRVHPFNFSDQLLVNKRIQVENDRLTSVSIRIEAGHLRCGHKNHVTLVVSSATGIFRNETTLKVNRSPGYMFVQTDKPMYTPRQTVKYRVIALDENQRWAPSDWMVQIDIVNPRNHSVDRRFHSPQEAFPADEFLLSRQPMRGIWKIIASFNNTVNTKVTTQFEVKEYVLPRFRVTVTADPTVITEGETGTPLRLTVKANYVYDKPVRGSVSFSLLDGDTGIILGSVITGQLDSQGRLVHVIDGVGMEDMIIQNDLSDFIISVDVNVTEDGTGNVVRRKSHSIVFYSSHAYNMKAVNYRETYTPGFLYSLELLVTGPDAHPVSNVTLRLNVNGEDFLSQSTNQKGRVGFDINTSHREYLEIRVSSDDEEVTEYFQPTKERSGIGHFISVRTASALKVRRRLQVNITYSSLPRHYFLLVISRGRVIFARRYRGTVSGRDTRTIRPYLTRFMSPNARIVVFYVSSSGSQAEVVADSIFVDMENKCAARLKATSGGGEALPKGSDVIHLRGVADMRVGLLAVDRTLFFLKWKRLLKRKAVFREMESRDMGEGGGGGEDAFHTFQKAGLVVMTNADVSFPPPNTDALERSLTVGDDVEETERRDIMLRSFFPESWLFKEVTLNASGRGTVDIVYPDSITTWVIQAVGVSPVGGLCVAPSLKVRVFQPFFVDLYLPYRAVRLEEVEVQATISNYEGFNITVDMNVSGSGSLCLPDQVVFENVLVTNNNSTTKKFTVIGVRPGMYKIKVDFSAGSGFKRDSVEKTLYIVAEGQTRQKSIPIDLDPQGAVLVGEYDEDNITICDDVTVKQTANTRRREQYTEVDLTLPAEAIPETENIRITAFGDLLGEVVKNIVLGPDKRAPPQEGLGGEQVMSRLAPVVYGLKYLQQANRLNLEMVKIGRRHIRKDLSDLLQYRNISGGFHRSMDTALPSTWFTAFVLKTLCRAKEVIYVDQTAINEGFRWLLGQVTSSGDINETDRRSYTNEEGNKDISVAESLISTALCSFRTNVEQIESRSRLQARLERRLPYMNHSLALAKAAYALRVANSNEVADARRRLYRIKKMTGQGLIYWSENNEDSNESTPYFYREGPSADAIEATAYSLMFFLQYREDPSRQDPTREDPTRDDPTTPQINPDSIARWLLRWRNGNGFFVNIVDTSVATEALARYRASKHIPNTNLSCSITTSPDSTISRSIQFSDSDAIQPKTVLNLSVVKKLHMITRGSGLGQMHVDVSYSVSTDNTAQCMFNLSVERDSPREESLRTGSSDLCSACGVGCGQDFTCKAQTRPSSVEHTRVNHCLNICVRYTGNVPHREAVVTVGLLTGYQPVSCDLQQTRRGVVESVQHDVDLGSVQVHLKQVSNTNTTCFGFRIKRINRVHRLQPAVVTVREKHVSESYCSKSYHSGDNDLSLPYYCARPDNQHKEECQCVSDTCAPCKPSPVDCIFDGLKAKVRSSQYVYKVQVENITQENWWKRIIVRVQDFKKKTVHLDVDVNSRLTFLTKQTCGCPLFRRGSYYWAAGNVTRYNTQDGSDIFRYFVSHNTFILGPSGCSGDRTFNITERNLLHAVRIECSHGCT